MAEDKAVTQLATKRFQSAEHMRNIWYVTPEHGTPFDAVIDPKYWAHVSARMRPRDRIEVDAEDGTYFAELMVIDAGRLFAKVKVLRKHDFESKESVTDAGPDFEVKYAGPHAKWRVLRKSDRAVLKEGCEDKQAALTWAQEHSKALAA